MVAVNLRRLKLTSKVKRVESNGSHFVVWAMYRTKGQREQAGEKQTKNKQLSHMFTSCFCLPVLASINVNELMDNV